MAASIAGAEESRSHILPPRHDAASYSFMIVDDSEFMLNNLKRVITGFGGDVVGTARNGIEALALYRGLAAKPDLITMDLTMPEMGGLETIQALRAENPKQRIVVVSALGQHAVVQQALMLGAGHFIVKPFKREDVFRIISTLLGLSTADAEAGS